MALRRFQLALITSLCFTSVFGQVSSGWTNPGTSSNLLSLGTVSFLFTSNITTSDNGYSVVTATVLNEVTHYISATNFGFSIPAGAVIDGIEVRAERSATLATDAITDNSVRLIIGGAVAGNDYKKVGNWPTTDTYATYGSSSDKWGNVLTPAIVNSSNFGVGFSIQLGGVGLPVARIDHIQINVHYTVPLPVGLMHFTATSDGKIVELDWATATELNNSHFEIQRSEDGESWSVLDEVNGAGFSNEEKNYRYRDVNNVRGYYRLKQVDLDGAFEYSPISYAFAPKEIQANELVFIALPNGLRILSEQSIEEVKLYALSGEEFYAYTSSMDHGAEVVWEGNRPEILVVQVKTADQKWSIRKLGR